MCEVRTGKIDTWTKEGKKSLERAFAKNTGRNVIKARLIEDSF